MRTVDGGYFAKAVAEKPEYVRNEGVREICSVSHCISPPPEDWILAWRHNDLGWFDTVADAWSVVPAHDRGRYRLFAYRLGLTRFRKGLPLEVVVPPDVCPDPIPRTFISLGWDAASKYMESVLGLECSPLSCNSMADEMTVNAFCLLGSEEAAVDAARRFSLEEPEPGDYYVVEVLDASS